MRDFMLTLFLNRTVEPTWEKVIEALRMGNYPNIAKKIQEDLKKAD